MDSDPYHPCPCGSGNKLKFCCADVATEMEKVERQLASNQMRMALQGLDKLADAHPDSQWVLTALGATLINENQPGRAKDVLARLLKKHPQQPYANALFALAAFNEDGFPESKRAINRACKLSTAAFPDIMSSLAAAVSSARLEAGQFLAARQSLVLAMRLAGDDRRPALFQQLVALDGEGTIPYPLRSVRQPVELQGIDPSNDAVRMAGRLAAVGCWDEAAKALDRLSEEHPDHAGLACNIGLYHAWDGDQAAAAVAFRKSARCETDFDTAVERELLAQLLEETALEHGVPIRVRKFEIESVSRLLTRLDEFRRLVRMEEDPDADEEGGSDRPAARYFVLHRELHETEDYASWGSDDVPQIIARVTIFDRDPEGDQAAQAFLMGLEGDELEQSLELFRSAAGELAAAVDLGSEDDITGHISHDRLTLRWAGHIPTDAPGMVARTTLDQWWQRVIETGWPDTPLRPLGGKSPRQAGEDPSLKVALAAAVLALDAHADARHFLLPIERIREQLGVAAPAPLSVTEQTNLNALTLIQLGRVSLKDLSTEQFSQMMKRSTVVRQSRLLFAVLQEALERPEELIDNVARDRVYASLSGLSARSLRHEEALDWTRKGREHAEGQPHPFEHVLEWKMRELSLRIEDPQDPQLTRLLEDLWQNYGAKLPQLREYLVTLVGVAGVKAPWDASILAPDAGMSGAPAWTSTSEPVSGTGSKLWLPGDR